MTIEEKLAKIAELASEVEGELEGVYKHADRLRFSQWQAGRMKLYALELTKQMELDRIRQPYYFHGIETDIEEPLFPDILISLSELEDQRLKCHHGETWKAGSLSSAVANKLDSKNPKARVDFYKEVEFINRGDSKPPIFETEYDRVVEVAKKYVAIID